MGKADITSFLSGRPGPGDKITQSILGSTSALNSFLRYQHLLHGLQVNLPVKVISFDDNDLFQYFFVTVQLREKGQEIVGIYLDQLDSHSLYIGGGRYLHES